MRLTIIVILLALATPHGEPKPGSWTVPSDASTLRPAPHLVGGKAVRQFAPEAVPPVAEERVAASGTYDGFASWASPAIGRSYLALREPRGTVARLCGPGGCWTAAVTDYGPSARIRPARVADIAVGQWERLCGVPRSFGLCFVTVTIISRPGVPLAPSTDTEVTP